MIAVGLVLIATWLVLRIWSTGWEVYYACGWGEYEARYDSLDRLMGRPIHPGMSVAPPWAVRKVRRRR